MSEDEAFMKALGQHHMILSIHREHGSWRQVGRCVYCSCGERLGQGTVPKDMEPPEPPSVLCECRKYRTRNPLLMAEHKKTCQP